MKAETFNTMKKVEIMYGVILPNGDYDNSKTFSRSVPSDIPMTQNNDYANRFRAQMWADFEEYAAAMCAEPSFFLIRDNGSNYTWSK